MGQADGALNEGHHTIKGFDGQARRLENFNSNQPVQAIWNFMLSASLGINFTGPSDHRIAMGAISVRS